MTRRSRYNTEFGTAVSAELAAAHLGQLDLAKRLGKTPVYLNRTLTGRVKPSPGWVDLVADTLKVSAEKRQALHVAAAKDYGFKIDLTKKE